VNKFVAASAWASSQNDDAEDEEEGNNVDSIDHSTAEKTSSLPLHNSSLRPQTYSLHLTRVPYEATQSEIRCSFIEKGCSVTSVRLVYDRDYKTGERNFRGVAFVDLADEKSFKRGLELNKTAFLGKGRKVNVRPTRTKNELSEIVRRTEEKVANLIARSKESAQTKKRESDGSSICEHDKSSGSNKKRKKGRKSSDASTPKAKSNNTEGSMEKPNNTKAKSSKRKRGTKSDKDDGSVKLTKKQRAKKAAVIRMMKIKGGKK
jgi:hypothetical protein